MKTWYVIKLMRPVNLLIIGFTMYIFHDFIGKCMPGPDRMNHNLLPGLVLLIVSTMLIAGAGNMINDYFDMRIDRVNKPEKVIVGKFIKRREAMLLHVLFNTLAVGAGVFLWLRYGAWIPAAVHVITTSLLWWYSVILKRKLLVGNVSIAVLTALVPLIVFWFEIPVLYSKGDAVLPEAKKIIYLYAVFAFLTTLIREIQKDFADEKGDAMFGCKTVPIAMGTKNGRMLLLLLHLVVIGLIAYAVFKRENIFEWVSPYFLPLILLPLFTSFYLTLRATSREAWLLSGNLMKLSMLGGILFLGAYVYAA